MKRHSAISPLKTAAVILMFFSAKAFSFDWPVTFTREGISCHFGQLRGGMFNTGLIFERTEEEPKEISSTEEGRITIVLEEHEESGWFESTLGNAVIIAHDDELTTVYGNLEKLSSPENAYIDAGVKIGKTGKSAWSEKNTGLEFQISDAKDNAFINPLILMPRLSSHPALTLFDIVLESKNGRTYDINLIKNLPAGSYNLYRKRQDYIAPYKTSIYVNGAEIESVTYDTIKFKNNRLCVQGTDTYSVKEIYPADARQFTGQVLLPHGRNTLTITVSDIIGNEKSLTYNLTAY